MGILTSSQLTFQDLKDSYSIQISPEYISLNCDNNGNTLQTKQIQINFVTFIGTQKVPTKTCQVNNYPSGIQVGSITQATGSSDGIINITIPSGTNLNTQFNPTIELDILINDKSEFQFKKYITLIKGTPGNDGKMYWIDCDTASINKNNGGEYTPSSINAYSKQRVGDNGASAYNCYFKIDQQILSNGNTTTWQKVYPVGTPRLENHVEYIPTGSTIYDTNNGLDVTSQYYSVNGEVLSISNASEDGLKSVRISIYGDSQLTQLIDQKIIPITVDGQDGVNGVSGYNSAIVYLYKRSDTAPTINWTNSLTYDFVNSKLVAPPSGWSETIPNGDAPLYVTAATAYSNSEYDTIGYQEWSTPPTLLVKNGEDGQPGSPGLNSSVIFLYQRKSSTPSKPSTTLQYDFATGQITPQSGLAGWTQNIPQSDGNPCYVIQCIAISYENTDNILSSEWSNPVILVEDGKSVVSFEIYSSDGDTFTDDVLSITLQVYAYDGTTEITQQDANFQWQEYSNSTWVNYTTKQNGATVEYRSKSLNLLRGNVINVSTYRCRMEYPKNSGIYYYSYYTVKDTTDIYRSEIRTIGGNVLNYNNPYVIAYIYVEKNGQEVDPLIAQIWSATKDPESAGDYYKIEDGQIQLKHFTGSSWTNYSSQQQQIYSYSWGNIASDNSINSFGELRNKVVLLDSKYISNSATFECQISDDKNNLISKCQMNFIDLNDPIVGDIAPQNPRDGQLWVDTKNNNNIKVYKDGVWEGIKAYSSSNIFIKKPEDTLEDELCYKEGDIWVVGDDYQPTIYDDNNQPSDKKYSKNTILICVQRSNEYLDSNWREPKDISDIRERLDRYDEVMKNYSDGLYMFKTNDSYSTAFYSKLTSQELGFWEKELGPMPDNPNGFTDDESRGTKVVWIGGKELHAKTTTVEGSITITNLEDIQPSLTIGNLKITKEQNNSYSILIN